MAKDKFAVVIDTVEALEQAASRVARYKQNLTISSAHSPVSAQVPAIKDLFRRMGINTLVTAKAGAWMKRLILSDIIINYHEVNTQLKNGEEAFRMATLMNRAMAAVRTILETNMPGLSNGYCPTCGIRDGHYRFQ